MNVLVCVKRVPATGGRVSLTADEQDIDTQYLGFTVSPHEECATEEAVQLIEAHGGSSTVLTLGPEAASEQLRDAMAVGIDRAILLETDGRDWDPVATADAIVAAVVAEREADQADDHDPTTPRRTSSSTTLGAASGPRPRISTLASCSTGKRRRSFTGPTDRGAGSERAISFFLARSRPGTDG